MRFRSAAKINLTLDILGRRDDGYHLLRSVVHTVGLWDELAFRFGAPWGIACNKSELQSDDNLCLRAARLYLTATGRAIKDHPLHITLDKTIPAGAGLGGGSGNAAATLCAMQTRFQDKINLEKLALQLGADVPLFLRGGCVLMEGIGEKLTPLAPLDGWLLLAKPAEFGRTCEIFAVWDETPISSNATEAMLRALGQNDLRAIAQFLGNDLRGAAQRCRIPVEFLETQMRRAGAVGASMTGSGSAVFGIFADEAAARRALGELQAQAENLSVFVAPFCARGLESVGDNLS